MELRLDWCSHEAATKAVMRWHYSRLMPKSKLVKIGVWEDGKFIGAVIFGMGAGKSTNGKRFGLREHYDMAELVRVALDKHRTPTSRIVALAIRMLRKLCPGLKLLTSFADTQQHHVGTIYQAGGWIYVGSQRVEYDKVNGRVEHPRTVGQRYGCRSLQWLRKNIDPNASRVLMAEKHQYLLPLDDEIRRTIAPLSKPYPKRAASIENDAPGLQPGEGGANPTAALQHR